MDHPEQLHLSDQVDECDVCQSPILDLSKAFTNEYDQKVLTFCTERCFKRYLEDPELYNEFNDDDVLDKI